MQYLDNGIISYNEHGINRNLLLPREFCEFIYSRCQAMEGFKVSDLVSYDFWREQLSEECPFSSPEQLHETARCEVASRNAWWWYYQSSLQKRYHQARLPVDIKPGKTSLEGVCFPSKCSDLKVSLVSKVKSASGNYPVLQGDVLLHIFSYLREPLSFLDFSFVGLNCSGGLVNGEYVLRAGTAFVKVPSSDKRKRSFDEMSCDNESNIFFFYSFNSFTSTILLQQEGSLSYEEVEVPKMKVYLVRHPNGHYGPSITATTLSGKEETFMVKANLELPRKNGTEVETMENFFWK